MNTKIELATPLHLPSILLLVKEAVSFMHTNGNYQWDSAYPTATIFENDIANKYLYILLIEEAVQAFVVLNTVQSPEYATISWNTPAHSLCIHRMVVSNEYKGRGLAKLLLRFAEDIAIERAIYAIRCDSNSANKPMNGLITHFGYQFTGTIILRNNPVVFNCYDKKLNLKI